MDWVTALPPGGDRSFNACLVLVDRYRKPPMLLPCHEDDTSMDKAIILLNRVISNTGLFQNIITEIVIQKLEDIIIRFCAYVLELKDSDGFTHDWCTLIPALELEYKTSIHSSTGKTPVVLEKCLNTRLPHDKIKKDLVDIHPTASSFKITLDKARHNAQQMYERLFQI
ncbi:hypothetical protein O181_014960 [Austropuccinia psidii MF-1]|uniref:Integrase catalytic domain-containing protein n=1 Tax=Austropuccinia psidii MF-1 TaxID=1389203 RepID=A0A9Q3C2X4_9BASI|nr:hypothetical protein [Austropuccinia psidii MF-1]